jgi:hypothetical protein
MSTVSVLHCPIPVDRKGRHGWNGDSNTRVVKCGFTIAYEVGEYEVYPNGPKRNKAVYARDALVEHIRSEDHTVDDFMYLATETLEQS